MKTTYTLTWDEYAEQFQDTWPRADYFAAIVVCIVAVPLLGYGISLAIFGMPDETLIYSMFIGGPLFLVIATIFSLRSQAGQARKRAIAGKRLDYERWYAMEKSFSFDQDKWAHETEAGRQESPWSALQVVIERDNVFYLTAEKGLVMVPKRVLDSSALSLFRHAALPVRDDGWTFQSRKWDYQAVATALLWRDRWYVMVFGNCLALVVLGWIVQSWISQNSQPVFIWGWILAAFAVILTLTAQLWYLPLRYVTWPNHRKASMVLEFSDLGLYFATAQGNFFLNWKTFRKFREVGRAFLLYTGPSQYYLLPKQDITRDQQNEFRQMLQKKIKSE
jgi:hypothetical protein